jgi:uncharacterized protein YdeI (YjbR/CyaY-like superfamily)
MPTAPKKAIDSVVFATAAQWDSWLAKNHDKATGVWIRIAKKASGKASVGYPEVLDIAISWGWIDALRRAHDEHWYLQRFTPRTKRSPWSKINCAKALAMIRAQSMQAPGLAEVQRARKDGRWQKAYAGQKKAAVPADLAAALAKNKKAAAFFATLDSKNRYAVLYRIQSVKKAQTRAAKIASFVAMLARGERIHATTAAG